jgi:O-antigen/teichoic acid export membrane protein
VVRRRRFRIRAGTLAVSAERSLAHGTAWMMVAQAATICFQALYFILIARALGVDRFGALAASLAVVGIFVPFAAWGYGNLLVRDVARAPAAFPAAYGSALMSIAGSALILVPAALAIGMIVLPDVPVTVFLFLGFADLVFARIVDLAALAFQAINRLDVTAAARVLVPCIRCIAVVVFVLVVPVSSLVTWAALYCLATIVAATVAMVFVHTRLGGPRIVLADARGKIKVGGLFAISASAGGIYADIDKMMLGRLSTFDATGIYAAADRAVGMAFAPVMALLTAAYPRFFKAGSSGIKSSADYARKLARPSVGYGVAAGICIFVLAPLTPYILGSDFTASVDALRWLAPMPAINTLCYLSADALTGADAQGLRTLLQLCTAVLNIGLNIFLIPAYSWHGAAWATLICGGFLASTLWLTVLLLERRTRPPTDANEPQKRRRTPQESG